MKRKTSKRGTAAGFSLLELLTVLVLLGILAGIAAPSAARLLAGLEFRKQIGEIMAQVRFVRLQAVVSGQHIEMRIQNNDIMLYRGGKKQGKRVFEIDPECELTMNPAEIIFTPQSTVTPATLRFSSGDRSGKINLDPLTALPIMR